MTIFRPGKRLAYLDPSIRVSYPTVTAAANWWEPTTGSFTVVAAYQPIGAANLTASYANLANPGTFDAAPGVAPTWDAVNGWIYNGAQHLTTGIIHGSGWCAVVRFSNMSGLGNRAAFGALTTGSTWLVVRPSPNQSRTYGQGGFIIIAGGYTAGIMAVGNQQGYYNGVADGGAIGAWSGTNTADIYMGALNNNGTVSNHMIGNIQALAIYSTTLNPTQVAEISAAMAAL